MCMPPVADKSTSKGLDTQKKVGNDVKVKQKVAKVNPHITCQQKACERERRFFIAWSDLKHAVRPHTTFGE